MQLIYKYINLCKNNGNFAKCQVNFFTSLRYRAKFIVSFIQFNTLN